MLDDLREAKEIISKCLFVPEDRITDDADINSIKPLDSLAFESLVLEIEDRTGKEIDPLRLLELKTIRDLAAILKEPR